MIHTVKINLKSFRTQILVTDGFFCTTTDRHDIAVNPWVVGSLTYQKKTSTESSIFSELDGSVTPKIMFFFLCIVRPEIT